MQAEAKEAEAKAQAEFREAQAKARAEDREAQVQAKAKEAEAKAQADYDEEYDEEEGGMDQDDMYAMITQFDEGGKGYLSKEEFFSMMEETEGLGHEECEDLYHEVDTDGNGVLSIVEMCDYFQTQLVDSGQQRDDGDWSDDGYREY